MRQPLTTAVAKRFLGFLILTIGFILVQFGGIQPANLNRFFKPCGPRFITRIPRDLQEMERRLQFKQIDNFHLKYFYTQDPNQAALARGLAAKVDGLLARVCLILNQLQGNSQVRIFPSQRRKAGAATASGSCALCSLTIHLWIWQLRRILRTAEPNHLPVA